MNNERLLAFETEQAKRNTKHSSERTVITHKPVSALLEGLLLCVNDLSCLWHSALWLRVWLLKSCNHVAEGNKDVIYGWFHNRWLSKMTLSPSHKSISVYFLLLVPLGLLSTLKNSVFKRITWINLLQTCASSRTVMFYYTDLSILALAFIGNLSRRPPIGRWIMGESLRPSHPALLLLIHIFRSHGDKWKD